MINVSELITDPDFAQPNGIKIIRSTVETVNHRQVENPVEITLAGIITVANETSDELLDEADRSKEQIHIFTHERLKLVGVDKVDGKRYASDIVKFNGAKYIVRYCLDDSQYGSFFASAQKF